MHAQKLPPRWRHARTDDAVSVMFVLCSEDYATGELLAACEPAIVHQAIGGARNPEAASTRATFAYAIHANSVRRVTVCGHLGCRAVDDASDRDLLAKAALAVAAQCGVLREDGFIGALLRDYDVILEAVSFDPFHGRLYACDIESGSSTLLELEPWRARLREPLTEDGVA